MLVPFFKEYSQTDRIIFFFGYIGKLHNISIGYFLIPTQTNDLKGGMN